MLNEKATIVLLKVGLIKKILIYKNQVKLNLSNYPTKSDLKKATGVNTLKFAKNDDLTTLKSKVDKVGIDKLVELDADNLKSVTLP